ncbi:MAG: hypothetical protein FWG67_09990 [Defluviitaleaceae bacterium]|nr:hypothetical protein [Defluviitaleaceae bacterium]
MKKNKLLASAAVLLLSMGAPVSVNGEIGALNQAPPTIVGPDGGCPSTSNRAWWVLSGNSLTVRSFHCHLRHRGTLNVNGNILQTAITNPRVESSRSMVFTGNTIGSAVLSTY